MITNPPPTWQQLLSAEPGLAAFEVAAEQAGRNGWSGWLRWLQGASYLRAMVGRHSRNPATRSGEAWRVVADHLRAVHRQHYQPRHTL